MVLDNVTRSVAGNDSSGYWPSGDGGFWADVLENRGDPPSLIPLPKCCPDATAQNGSKRYSAKQVPKGITSETAARPRHG